MSRTHLPREVSEHKLTYRELIEDLDLLKGELVVVRVAMTGGDAAAVLVGPLAHWPSRAAGVDEFFVGTPWPEFNPDHLVGGIFKFSQLDFVDARLTTLDGNDYFIFRINAGALSIEIQDADSGYPVA